MKSEIKNLNFEKFNQEHKMLFNLNNIYGIGFFFKKELLLRLGYSRSDIFKIKTINSFFLNRLHRFCKCVIKPYDTRRKQLQKFLRLEIKIKTKKSYYLRYGYPVNNQRRKTNGKIARRLNKILYNSVTKKG